MIGVIRMTVGKFPARGARNAPAQMGEERRPRPRLWFGGTFPIAILIIPIILVIVLVTFHT